MPLEKQQFDALLRLAYPDAVERCGSRSWGIPQNYQDPADRQAALVYPLLNDHAWERLRDVDKVELTRLAGEDRPLADLYNYVDYRMNQKVQYDGRNTVETARYGPGSGWQPHVEPDDTHEAATRRISPSISRADRNAWRANQEYKGFTPGPPPGSRPVAPEHGAHGQAGSTGTGPAARAPHTRRPGQEHSR